MALFSKHNALLNQHPVAVFQKLKTGKSTKHDDTANSPKKS